MNQRGFTLIELLVVVGLLGIIITGVLANMNSTKRKAYDVVALSCAQDIARKEKLVQSRNERYDIFDQLPDMSSCNPLVELNAAPFGDAEELRFIYEVRHPKGNTIYTVTDSELYTNGVAKTGEPLTSDPAMPLFDALLAGGPGGGPGGGLGAVTMEDCFTQNVEGKYTVGNISSGIVRQITGNPGYPTGAVTTTYRRLAPDVLGTHYDNRVTGEQQYAVFVFMDGQPHGEYEGLTELATAARIPSVAGDMTAAEYATYVQSLMGRSAPLPAVLEADVNLNVGTDGRCESYGVS